MPKCFACRCANGYYGDPRRGCQKCNCPGTNGVQHADSCSFNQRTNQVTCNCRRGYTGLSPFLFQETLVIIIMIDNNNNNNNNNNNSNGYHYYLTLPYKNLNNLDIAVLKFAGPNCNQCADNYFGNPTAPGGRCEPCQCNNNVDLSVPGSCDALTGECRRCLYNTEGRFCERCINGYYGDAPRQDCRR